MKPASTSRRALDSRLESQHVYLSVSCPCALFVCARGPRTFKSIQEHKHNRTEQYISNRYN